MKNVRKTKEYKSCETVYTGDFNKNRGITLIALVITIIILLILAGIAIGALVGDNGLFKRAKEARTETMTAKYEEDVNRIIMEAQVEKYAESSEERLINIVKNKIKEQEWCASIQAYNKAGEAISEENNTAEVVQLIITTKDNYEIGIEARDENVEIGYVVYGEMQRYTITYNSNDGTDNTVTQSIPEGNSAILKENPFTREKYTFVGWIESPGAETVYQSGAEYPEGGIKEDITLYAKWEQDIVKIIYNVNDGTGKTTEVEVGKNSKIQLTGNEVTREDYRLIGWMTEPNGDVVYGTDDIVEIKANDITLYAKWEKIIYHLWDTYSVYDPSYYKESFYSNGEIWGLAGFSMRLYPSVWFDSKTGEYTGDYSKSVKATETYGACTGWYYINLDNRREVWKVIKDSYGIAPEAQVYSYTYKVNVPKERGTSLNKQAKSENRNAYPDDGASGSIWYVYIGTNE